MKYKTKPVEIEAIQFTGDNYEEIRDWAGKHDDFYIFQPISDAVFGSGFDYAVYDKIHDTWVKVAVSNYIIRGPKREYYPCDEEVFDGKYEPM